MSAKPKWVYASTAMGGALFIAIRLLPRDLHEIADIILGIVVLGFVGWALFWWVRIWRWRRRQALRVSASPREPTP